MVLDVSPNTCGGSVLISLFKDLMIITGRSFFDVDFYFQFVGSRDRASAAWGLTPAR